MSEMLDRLRYLLNQYAGEKATLAEENELWELIADPRHEHLVKNVMQTMLREGEVGDVPGVNHWAPLLEKIMAGSEAGDLGGTIKPYPGIRLVQKEATGDDTPLIPINKHRRKTTRWWWAAASLFILFSSGAYFLFKQNKNSNTSGAIAKNNQRNALITPGSNKAYLTLSDGAIVDLDSLDEGAVFNEGAVKILKKEDGQISYQVAGKNTTEVVYNTIATPRGGKYEIGLPDGTKVWLNAESSLKFPLSFKGDSRTVVLSGEGYFEIAKNSRMPFKVHTNNIQVEVLGTHFNVNAYKDENKMTTTVLEGAVKVSNPSQSSDQSIVLTSGQQAGLVEGINLKMVEHPNIAEAMAWKNGMFEFNNADITSIMRQVSRWYNVDVRFADGVPVKKFTGKFSRNVSLDQIINMLRFAGINMELESGNIVVLQE